MSFTKSSVDCYSIRPEENERHRCLWALVYVDSNTWTLSASSDCGDYSYRWGYEDGRTFKQFLTTLDKSYFLSKISDRTEIDEKESIIRMKEFCINMYRKGSINKQEAREQFDHIKDIENGYYDDDFEHAVYENLDYDDYNDLVVHKYPVGAIAFYEVIFKELQKILKDEINQGSEVV
jgi:hypothetical protein